MANNLRFIISVDSAGAISGIRAYSSALAATGPAAQKASTQANTAFSRLEANMSKMKSAVIGFIGAFVFIRITRGIKDIIDAGIQFETSFAGIRKTVEGTEQDFARLSNEMRQLAKEIPIGVNELNKIGELGGQLGVPTNKLREFTETIAKIGLATNMSVEEAADGFAHLGNVLGIPADNIKTLASVIVDLGNKFPATESEILQFSLNIAGAGKAVGLSATEITALSTALASVGLHAEKAGSAMSRILLTMQDAIAEGGESLETFADVALGVTATGEDFAKMFSENASNALIRFLGGLDKLSGTDAILALKELSLSEIRVRDVTLRAKEAWEMFGRAIEVGNAEFGRAGAALDHEVNKRLATTAVELAKVTARFNDLFIDISNKVKPMLVETAKAAADLAEAFMRGDPAMKAFVQTVLALGAALVLLKLYSYVVLFGQFALAIYGVEAALAAGIGGLVAWDIAMAAVSKQFAILGASPLMRIALYAGLAYEIFNLTNAIIAWDSAWQDVTDAENRRSNAVMTSIDTLKKHGIVIDRNGKSLEELEAEISEAGKGMSWFKSQQDLVTASTEAATEKIKLRSAAEKEAAEDREKQIQKLISGTSKYADESNILNAALQRMIATATPLELIMRAQADAISGTVDELKLWNKEIPETIARMEALAQAWRHAKMAPLKDELERDLSDMKLPSMPGAGGGSLPVMQGIDDNPVAALARLQRSVALAQIQSIGALSIKVAIEEAEKERLRKELQEITDGLTAGFHKVFETLIRKGKLDMRDLAKFTAELFEKASDGFFAPLVTRLSSLSDWLGKKIADGVKKASSAISNTLSDIMSSVFGDKIGKQLGGIIGDIAGAGIGAAIGLALNKLFSMDFMKSGSEVNNKLVKDLTNPFNEAVEDLMTTFSHAAASGKLTLQTAIEARSNLASLLGDYKRDTAEYAKLGAKQSAAVRGAFETMAKYWGVDLKLLFDDIDAQIVALGGTAGMTLEEFEALNSTLAEASKFAQIVEGIVKSVTKNADGLDAMLAALEQLEAAGIPTEIVIKRLGSQIIELAEELELLGLAVPPVIDSIRQLAEATVRIGEIDEELEDLSKQLGDALIRKLNFLDTSIDASSKKILDWSNEIFAVNARIAVNTKTLQDAAHWQKMYDDAIKESADNMKQLAEKRKSLEGDILDAQNEIRRSQLQELVDMARTPGQRADAQKNLDAYERTQRVLEARQRILHLSELRRQLIETQQEQEKASVAYEKAKEDARFHVANQQAVMQSAIDMDRARLAELLNLLVSERERLFMLRQEKAATEEMMKVFGIARLDEISLINQTVMNIIARSSALIEERNILGQIPGVTAQATSALIDFMQRMREFNPTLPAPQIPVTVTGSAGQGGIAHIPRSVFRGTLPSFDMGGPTGHGGPSMLHANEYVVPEKGALVVRGDGGGDVNVYLTIEGNVIGNREFVNDLTDQIVRKVQYGGKRFPSTQVLR